jgi:hypothetical protein
MKRNQTLKQAPLLKDHAFMAVVSNVPVPCTDTVLEQLKNEMRSNTEAGTALLKDHAFMAVVSNVPMPCTDTVL